MIEIARARLPQCTFTEMDMRHLVFPDASFDGILAAYSLIHIPSSDLRDVLQEFARVLRPGGVLLVIAQLGEPDHLEDDPLAPGEQVFVNFFSPDRLRGVLENAGFTIQVLSTKGTDDIASMSSGVVYALAEPLGESL